MTKETLAREWLPVAVSNIKNYVELDGDGQPYFDLRKATDDQWKAIKQIQVDELMDGRANGVATIKRTRILLHDKITAGMSIARLFGWIINKNEDVTRLEERLAKMANMPALLNPRQERFCQEIVRGQNLADAYRIAGYEGSIKNASKMRTYPAIVRRVEELIAKRQSIDYASTQRAIERLALTKEALAREWVPLATSNMRNYVRMSANDSTQPVFDFSKVTREQWAAVRAIHIKTSGENVQDVRFWLHPKIDAGMAIAKLFGWIINKNEDVTRLEERLAKMTPEERAREAERDFAQARRQLAEYRAERAAELEAQGDADGGIGEVYEAEPGDESKEDDA